MPTTIEKLELLLQNNAKTSEKMCRFYCVLLLKTHMNYLGKKILCRAAIMKWGNLSHSRNRVNHPPTPY